MMMYDEALAAKKLRFLTGNARTGGAICRDISKIADIQAEAVKHLLESRDATKVRTEIERLIDYEEYVQFCTG